MGKTRNLGARGEPPVLETMRDRFAAVTTELIDADDSVAVVLADISVDAFESVGRRHPDRVVNVGIREQLLVSVGGGLALTGMRPILHTYAPFLVERAFEQVKLDLGHQDVGAVLVSIGASYDRAQSGRTHQAPGDVALIGTLPNWTVHVPGHPDEADLLLRDAVAGSGRVYVRLSDRANAAAHLGRAGRAVTLRKGRRGTVVAVGPMLDPVLAATEDLDVAVVYAATVRPLDAHTVRAAVGAEPSVVLVEPYLTGTSSHAVTDALRDVPHRLLALGVRDAELHRYGTAADHDRAHGLDPAGLRRDIVRFLELAP
ncbi:MAG TPA: transketolase C-terminal domain-containing protein [Nocardioidaceae bacterium]|nr:transketolase C-terminal domain-containing protein [Nocardioidaceae bacterium]